ncbi:CBL-interacting protein kinase 5-like [Phoenix dactylifera]|uniref:non-specific serine/threonine protein kinase n=1 Tax=Phoenix dactylifera TaxID=42345 RepID=A0A8B8J4A9_PHODC|nr:CBL-interacting protein kinase 5-like [Phoenix dactylifera]
MERGTVLMRRYELGRLLGQGTFAKVYKARNILTGETVAIKIIDKEKVLRTGMIDQIKREIAIMRLVRHPNVVQLYEVMATKSKIFFAMELVRGGELFAKVAKGRLSEDMARKYFQQLVGAVDFCHSRGVYHRDLKPENLLLDDSGNLKVSDFGLSALRGSRRQDGLLHTTCGTPAYVAPEVINRKGYDGAKADIWSCGVILFVLMAGYLPFNDPNLITMYGKISRGEFRCPTWFPSDIRKLLSRLLDPNPNTRITMSKLMENSWFRKGFKPVPPTLQYRGSPCPRSDGDVHGCMHGATFPSEDEEKDEAEEEIKKKLAMSPIRPCCLNAFDIISRSQVFDLSGLFEKEKGVKAEARFTSKKPAAAIVSKLEEIAQMERFKMIKEKDGVVKLEGSKKGRKGQLEIEAEIFEVSPALFLVEMKKLSGDTLEYQKFYHQELRPSLKDIVWTWQVGDQSPPPQTLALSPLRPPLPVPASHPACIF